MAPLTKGELIKYLRREEVPGGYVFVNNGEKREFYCNLGVPSMLIRSISQFRRVSLDKVTFEDALTMYRTINTGLGNARSFSLKRWRRDNNLSFFGMSQYALLEYYLKNAK